MHWKRGLSRLNQERYVRGATGCHPSGREGGGPLAFKERKGEKERKRLVHRRIREGKAVFKGEGCSNAIHEEKRNCYCIGEGKMPREKLAPPGKKGKSQSTSWGGDQQRVRKSMLALRGKSHVLHSLVVHSWKQTYPKRGRTDIYRTRGGSERISPNPAAEGYYRTLVEGGVFPLH